MATACAFSAPTQQFRGSPLEQAQCLLRRVRVGGNVDNPPAQIPEKLKALVGQPTDVTRQQLEAYLALKGISAKDIGGALTKGVSQTSRGTTARYFIIHDTSDEIAGNAFPPAINTAAWPPNDLSKRATDSAHIFINRLGQSATGHDYSVAWRATKYERPAEMKGLFLHHELIQPRIKGGFSYHAVGPDPGFTQATYDRLALCYFAAAVQAGNYLIPAFHCVLDIGLPDGHDDPQNFDLFQWGSAIEKLWTEITRPATPLAPAALVEAAPLNAPAETAPELETVRSDLRDGKRNCPVRRIKGTTALFFRAKIAVDADGSPRAYHPDPQNPESLDDTRNANKYSKTYIQGVSKNGHVGKGPRAGFYVSATSLQKGSDWDADAFVDAEFIPYIVLPDDFAPGVRIGDICTVINLKNGRSCSAIFADTNPDVGEASIRVALSLHLHDPSFPITKLARAGGDQAANYAYVVYPGSRFAAAASAPHWPVETINAIGDPLFEAWGGLPMVQRLFPDAPAFATS